LLLLDLLLDLLLLFGEFRVNRELLRLGFWFCPDVVAPSLQALTPPVKVHA